MVSNGVDWYAWQIRAVGYSLVGDEVIPLNADAIPIPCSWNPTDFNA